MNNLLEIENLKVEFFINKKWISAISGLFLTIKKNEVLGLVGESGSGKSTFALSLLNILDKDNARISADKIIYDGIDILNKPESFMQKIRGNGISMIFQEPMTSLNPVLTIGDQISEILILHKKLSSKAAKEKTIELLDLVKIPDPKKRIYNYPNHLSGGMRQRVMIAMAIACEPKVLIADEPTTALDVTIQAEVLELLKDLQQKIGMGMIFISHDLSVISDVCSNVAIMYCGKIIEYATVKEVFENPVHPYTIGLIKSIPNSCRKNENDRLYTIKGNVPHISDLPKGCSFQNRCDFVSEKCRKEIPKLEKKSESRSVACFNPKKDDE